MTTDIWSYTWFNILQHTYGHIIDPLYMRTYENRHMTIYMRVYMIHIYGYISKSYTALPCDDNRPTLLARLTFLQTPRFTRRHRFVRTYKHTPWSSQPPSAQETPYQPAWEHNTARQPARIHQIHISIHVTYPPRVDIQQLQWKPTVTTVSPACIICSPRPMAHQPVQH